MHIHHLALRTADLPRLERFYVDVFGLRVVRRDGERSVWLEAGGAIVMIERRGDGEPAIDSRSLELTCFAIAPDEHHAALRRLETAGAVVEGRTAYSIYFRDPDGRRVGVSSFPSEREGDTPTV